jgi:hypothetical protein
MLNPRRRLSFKMLIFSARSCRQSAGRFLYCGFYTSNKQTPWRLVRERIIPTERPPLVYEILVPTFVDRGALRGQRGGSPTVVNLSFLDRVFTQT